MHQALETIAASFPGYQTSATARPDGGYLLALRGKDGSEIKRVVSAAQITTHARIECLISTMRRDMALQFGEVPPVESLRRLREAGLPTYHHA
ncbi:DUF3509 domain-containing protein [Pseudomonas kuykendallii]|uniref:DUF3509 domain-containing protein n=1 Tax=Pseudomonas kuykendallii TaxID=1007099 RepID=A0A1H3DC55_9PSED|nr:DUF3509 domain-containing protein [Pseudomonas kuykendallii]MCQ4270338.1 DUF3509 domain-containing protein [Pseudomonas kuykendallii]SDX64043.1 Protein of unknown function [Pseudomonas kuykendallii]